MVLMLEIQAFTPWKISMLTLKHDSAVIIVLPNLTIAVNSGNYCLCLGSGHEVAFNKDRGNLVSSVEKIVQGEIGRMEYDSKNAGKINDNMTKLLLKINHLEEHIQTLENKIKSDNKQLKKKLHDIKLGLEYHPTGVQAHLLKDEFEQLSVQCE